MLRLRSFRARVLAWFVAVAVGPAAVLAVVAFVQLRKAEEGLALQHLQSLARFRAEALRTRLLQFRSQVAVLQRHDLSTLRPRIAEFGPQGPDEVAYGLVSPAGHLEAPDMEFDFDQDQLEALREGRPVLHGPYAYVATTLRDGGLAVVRVPKRVLFGLLADTSGLRRTAKTCLVDRDGRLVADGSGRKTRDSLAAGRRVWSLAMDAESGVYSDADGEEVLGARAPLGDWSVVARMDRAEATGPLHALALKLLLLGAVFFAIVAALLYLVGGRAERSMARMVGSLERAARGEFGGSVQGSSAFAEIDRVKDALNEMHQRLAERDGEIMRQRQELFCQRCELERLNSEIVAADRMKSEFVANMSHEVRTPLHSILTLSELLLQQASGPLGDEQRKQIGIIERNGHALFAMLGDILDFSKIEAGRVNVNPAQVVPGSVLADVREAVAVAASEKALDLRLDVATDLEPIRTDPEKLHRILLNLAHNAIKFTQQGSVTLRCAPHEGGGVLYEVRDTGSGIAQSELELIFEPFRQVDGSAKRASSGTGLGLSIARTLVELLGGRIGVESKEGEGTAFTVVLPARIPAGGPAAGRPVLSEDDVLVVGATAPSGEAVRAELRVAGIEAGRAVCGRDVRSALDHARVRALLLDAGIFAGEGVDVFSSLAPRLTAADTMILGYWVDPQQRRGGLLGELVLRPANGDGYRLECEQAAPLLIPERVQDEDRATAARWVEALRSEGATPIRDVIGRIVRRLDAARSVSAASVEPGAAGRRALLLDPDPDARYSMALQLERMGFEVERMGTLDLPADDGPLDLVVTEASLPGAPDAVSALAERGAARIVVVTADARARTRDAALSAGADIVLVKPVPLERLRAALVGEARQETVA